MSGLLQDWSCCSVDATALEEAAVAAEVEEDGWQMLNSWWRCCGTGRSRCCCCEYAAVLRHDLAAVAVHVCGRRLLMLW